jgi:hypothetical protein
VSARLTCAMPAFAADTPVTIILIGTHQTYEWPMWTAELWQLK